MGREADGRVRTKKELGLCGWHLSLRRRHLPHLVKAPEATGSETPWNPVFAFTKQFPHRCAVHIDPHSHPLLLVPPFPQSVLILPLGLCSSIPGQKF